MKLAVQELVIRAPIDDVFAMLVDPELFVLWMADAATRELRQLTARRTALVRDRTAVRHRIHSTLAGELVAVPFAKLFDKLDWLKSVPLLSQPRAFVDSDLRLLESLDAEIAMLDKELAGQAWQDEKVKLLLTLPGVDYHVAMTLLGALGDISRFKDGDHAASYLGLAPSTHQSAGHCYHGPITKQGSSVLRWALVQAAHRAAISPQFQDYYQRQRERHGAGKAAVALARKLAVIAFYRWRQAEHAARPPAKVEKVRERSWAGAWSEDRPLRSD